MISCLTVVAVALALPYTPLGAIFDFTPPPATFYLALVGLVVAYLFLVEVVKKWFLKRYSYLLEQNYVAKKRNIIPQSSDVFAVSFAIAFSAHKLSRQNACLQPPNPLFLH